MCPCLNQLFLYEKSKKKRFRMSQQKSLPVAFHDKFHTTNGEVSGSQLTPIELLMLNALKIELRIISHSRNGIPFGKPSLFILRLFFRFFSLDPTLLAIERLLYTPCFTFFQAMLSCQWEKADSCIAFIANIILLDG